MKKRSLTATILIVIGIGFALFAASLVFQLSEWRMIVLTLVFFTIGVVIMLSGIQIARGESIKEVISELFRAIIR